LPQLFDENGIRFQYPDNWKLDRQDGDDGWSVTVQSPDTAFLLITLRDDGPDTGELAEAVLAAMKEEYQELEADEAVDSLAGQPAVGHDIRFFSFDLSNTCWTRCCYTSQGTLLVLCQLNDLETERNEPVLRAISASLQTDLEDEG
jgi:hypothetical protein